MKIGLKKAYVIGLHFVILILLGIIVLAISLIRADRRFPGSQLSATYSKNNDKWGHYIQHDGRDIVVGVSEQLFGVDHILVAPPGSRFVWSFDREQGGNWKLFVSEYDTIEQADQHFENPQANHYLVDGYHDSGIDGFPDREAYVVDGVKKVYTIEPKVHIFKFETPVSDEP